MRGDGWGRGTSRCHLPLPRLHAIAVVLPLLRDDCTAFMPETFFLPCRCLPATQEDVSITVLDGLDTLLSSFHT